MSLIFLVLLNLAFAGNGITDTHRVCKADSDCAVILLTCRCMYCAEPEDVKAGVVDAVNKKFSDQFKELASCAAEHCAVAGPCIRAGESLAVCKNQKCSVVYKAGKGKSHE